MGQQKSKSHITTTCRRRNRRCKDPIKFIKVSLTVLEGLQMVKVVEEYIVSILGVEDKPLPSVWHLQKELFILTKMNPNIQKLLKYVPHYEGPYSQVLQESYQEPMCFDDAFETRKNEEIVLTERGEKSIRRNQKRVCRAAKSSLNFLQAA